MIRFMLKSIFMMNWPITAVMVVGLVIGLAGTTTSAMASTVTSVEWTSPEDFEMNASTVGTPTTRLNIDSTTSPGDLRIGVTRDFVTTATITCVTASNKIYSTGVDRTSIAVIDGVNKSLLRMISLPGKVAGVVYNSTNNKLYVGQYSDNKVVVIDVATDTIIHTITSGSIGTGAYAATYNSKDNKVYVANTGDQTVTILDGISDSPLVTVPVVAGATTAAYDDVADKVYFTSKANQFVTIIDGRLDLVQDVGIAPPVNILGGQVPGNVGLRFDTQQKGITGANVIHLTWKHNPVAPGQSIKFQVRTAPDVISLDNTLYTGPGISTSTWYETPVGSSTETTTDLDIPFSRWLEIQVQLDSDGLDTPVLNSVTLSYESYPDLTVTSVSATPTTVTIGNTISVSSTVQNSGPGAAGSSSLGYYLVRNGTSYFLGAVAIPALDPGQSFLVNPVFTVPSIPTGSYTLKACADYSNLVQETFEDNNCRNFDTNLTLHAVQPDLVVTTVTTPSTAGTGQSFSVPVTLKNQGGATPTGAYANLYLCPTTTVNANCVAFGPMNFGGLTLDQSVTYNFSVTVPAITSGTYYFVALADPSNTIQEYDEGNNSSSWLPIEITYGPDLLITAITAPTSAVTGQALTIPVTAKNQGIGSTLSAVVNVTLYLCPTTEVNANCTNFGYMNFGGLTPGQSRSYNFSNVLVPAVTNGRYYFVTKIDPDNIIAESVEGNNTSDFAPIDITYGPDLVVTAVTPPASVAPGQLVSVPVTAKNQGVGSTLSAPVNVSLYFCPTNQYSVNCTYYGYMNFGGLTPNQSRTYSFTNITVPSVPSGTYYFVAVIDPTNIIPESSEDNNSTGTATTVN